MTQRKITEHETKKEATHNCITFTDLQHSRRADDTNKNDKIH